MERRKELTPIVSLLGFQAFPPKSTLLSRPIWLRLVEEERMALGVLGAKAAAVAMVAAKITDFMVVNFFFNEEKIFV